MQTRLLKARNFTAAVSTLRLPVLAKAEVDMTCPPGSDFYSLHWRVLRNTGGEGSSLLGCAASQAVPPRRGAVHPAARRWTACTRCMLLPSFLTFW